jgi:hypothetical protein
MDAKIIKMNIIFIFFKMHIELINVLFFEVKLLIHKVLLDIFQN